MRSESADAAAIDWDGVLLVEGGIILLSTVVGPIEGSFAAADSSKLRERGAPSDDLRAVSLGGGAQLAAATAVAVLARVEAESFFAVSLGAVCSGKRRRYSSI